MSMEYVRKELGVPEDSVDRSVESPIGNIEDFEAYEFEGREYSSTYIQVEGFRNNLGYTLKEVTEWLDTRYRTDFSSLDIDDFEYGDGWILLRREKDEE